MTFDIKQTENKVVLVTAIDVPVAELKIEKIHAATKVVNKVTLTFFIEVDE